jgi:hypothetical protein
MTKPQNPLKPSALIVLLLLVTLSSTSLYSQETGEDKLGAWYMYFGMNRISDDWSIHSEAQFRFYETLSEFNQLLLRTGANYHISDRAIATLGYAYIWTDPTYLDEPLQDAPFAGNEINEHRIFQQFLLYNAVGKFKFEHRYRLEQRFLSQEDFETGQRLNDTQHRARYRLQVTFPLTDTFFLNGYNELFINLQEPLFGQNRLYLALGAKLNPELSLQAGFLKNSFSGADFNRLQLGVFFNPDLRKKQSQP